MPGRVFYPLTVAEVRRETADAVSVALEVPVELADAFRFSPGQFLTFRVPGRNGRTVQRSYSICSGLDDGELRIVVKWLPGGVFGERANTTLSAGEVLETSPPLGRFTVPVDPANEKSYLALAAGSGIAPVMSLLRSLLAREPRSRFTLVYGNRGPATTIFREEIAEAKDRYLDRLQVVHLFSREQRSPPLLNGRLNDGKVRELSRQLLELSSYDEAFVCGPERMTVTLRESLISLGLDPRHIHLELYGSHGTPQPKPPPTDDRSVTLTVTLNGVTSTVPASPKSTILDAAAAAGLDVPFSCTGGVCATCRARVSDGAVEMAVNYALEPWELDAGYRLTCQSRPVTEAVTVDYDAV
jgi:ring-1,2-phenylacetyl-CoA epoxidase subunit PaaE